MMFAGFFADLSELPAWFAWIQYISPFKFGYEMLLVNEFEGLPLECKYPEGFPGDLPCPITSGDQVLRFLDLTYRDIWVSVFALLLQTLMWHLLAFALLHFWSVWACAFVDPPDADRGSQRSVRIEGAHRIYRRRYTNVRG